jgi:hypothetical protein
MGLHPLVENIDQLDFLPTVIRPHKLMVENDFIRWVTPALLT